MSIPQVRAIQVIVTNTNGESIVSNQMAITRDSHTNELEPILERIQHQIVMGMEKNTVNTVTVNFIR